MPSGAGPPVDLRSDTVSRPGPGMRAAMAQAEVGDDVYGEDGTVLALQERVADLLGHQAGLFCPSGSLANQLAARMLVPPGGELLCEAAAHVVRAELGAAATFSGITTRTWTDPDGRLDAARPLALLQPAAGPYLVSTSAVAVENTHNLAGGVTQPLGQVQALHAAVAGTGVRLHLDGARLWNATVATGEPLDTWGRLFDTVSVCFSKGLGAPVGSMLLGSHELVAEARVWRKRYGAGLRQVGILAAGAAYALDHQATRLVDDHEHARWLAVAAAEAAAGVVDPADVRTNIVVLDVARVGLLAAPVVRALTGSGVLTSAFGPGLIRLVTHLDVSRADARRAAEVLRAVLAAELTAARSAGPAAAGPA